VVIDLLLIISSLTVPVMWFEWLTGGFEPAGIDGLVLLATLVVFILCVISRRSEPRDAETTSRDETSVEQARSVNRVPAANSRSTGDIALAQPVSSGPEPPIRALSGVSALPALVVTRLRLRSAPVAALALVAGVLFVWIGQRALLGVDPGAGAFAVWLAGLLMLVFLYDQAGGMPGAVAYATTATPAGLSGKRRAVVLFGVGVVSIYIWHDVSNRAATDSSLDLVLLWLASIVALIIAAAGPPRREHATQLRAWAPRVRGDILITVVIAFIALIPRVYDLSRYPWALSGDEGTFAVTARSVLRGELSYPFTSGPWGYPSLLFIFQGRLMGLTGETASGSRMLSAVLGTASVVAIYWLTRHHFGRWTGLVAGVIAAAFNYHLFWSRNAQNAIAPMFFIPLALLFLDRGLIGRSRVDSLAAGLVIGFAQFFHPSNRILFPIAAAYAAYALIYQRPKCRDELVRAVRLLVPNVLWVAAGVIAGHLPLLSYFYSHRVEYSDRTNQVSVFASGWLEREQEITGKGALEILWIQFQNAALLPFRTVPGGHFHPDVPFASWPLVIPLAIGMAIVTLTFWRRQSFGLALAFWAAVAGMALTNGSPQTNRYTSSGPFLAIFAAIGITAVACIAIRLVHLPRIPVAALAAAATLLIAGWHLNWYFEDPNPVAVSSDANTQIANRLAHEAALYGSGLTVYFSGAPRLTYGGFANIPFIAPGATGIDVVEPWTADEPLPVLTGPTLFAFVPERLGELDVVRAWFPDGTIMVSTMPDGEEILTTYFVDAPVVEPASGYIIVLNS
jgi:4-amino-4-deoxy-L-arabinose transferase-like glycosyltransferase/Ca2+/Na+ antiporter